MTASFTHWPSPGAIAKYNRRQRSMTDSTLKADLAAAKEGSRELSDRVLLAFGWYVAEETNTFPRMWMQGNEGQIALTEDEPRPDPTRSIDDAAALMPEGKRFKVGRDDDGIGYASVGGPRIYESKTPALAICLAALEAREIEE